MKPCECLSHIVVRFIFFELILLLFICENQSIVSKGSLCDEDSLLRPNVQAKSSFTTPPRLAIVTSVTPDIVPKYAGHALAVNAVYAERRGYAYHIFSEDQHSQLQLDADARWNKVLFLLETMKAHDYEYVAWVDADLVILDFSLDLVAIANQHHTADIIMSKDKATAPFIGNTGLIIIRNTNWSMEFLQKWWSSFDRSRCCDQHALTWLLKDDDSRKKVMFLPTHIIGSDFPIWTQFHNTDPVVHLAGLTSLVRKAVFSFAWRHVCRPSIVDENSLSINAPTRIPLTKEFLWDLLVQLDRMRIEALEELLGELLRFAPSSDAPANIALLLRYHKDLLDIVKGDDDEHLHVAGASTQRSLAETQVRVYAQLFHQLHAAVVDDAPLETQPVDANRITHYVELVSIGFELLISAERVHASFLDKGALVAEVEQLISSVLAAAGLGDRVYARFQYYSFKLNQLAAKIAKADLQDAQEEERLLGVSVQQWQQLRQQHPHHYHSAYVNVEPEREYLETLVVLGTRYCGAGRHQEGAALLEEAGGLQEEVLARLGVVQIVTTDDEARAKLLRAEIAYNTGLCLANLAAQHPSEVAATSRKATEYLQRSLDVFGSYPNAVDNYAAAVDTARRTLLQLDRTLGDDKRCHDSFCSLPSEEEAPVRKVRRRLKKKVG
eukprot:gene31890-38557_t